METNLEPKMEAPNTACERINYALDRIARKGWIKNCLRKRVMTPDGVRANLDGPACLLGSLVTDDEYAALRTYKLIDEQTLEGVDDSPIYYGTLPGLAAACHALNLSSTYDTWSWNDEPGRTVEEVIVRLADGKKRACA